MLEIVDCRYCDLNEIVEECPFEIKKTKKTVNVKNECKARELCCVSVCVFVSAREQRETLELNPFHPAAQSKEVHKNIRFVDAMKHRHTKRETTRDSL